MEEAVIHTLLRADAVAALVGRRVRPGQRLQGDPLPSIVFTRVGGADDLTTEGPSGTTDSRIQIDCYGASAAEARTVAKAVRAHLRGFQDTVTVEEVAHEIQLIELINYRDGPAEGEDPDKVYRHIQEHTVWAVEPS